MVQRIMARVVKSRHVSLSHCFLVMSNAENHIVVQYKYEKGLPVFFCFNVHFSSAEGWTGLAWLDLLKLCEAFSLVLMPFLTTSDDTFGRS